jgi:formylglycine-generating enzyme required for sulfatase activity
MVITSREKDPVPHLLSTRTKFEDCVHNNYDGAPADNSSWVQGGNCNSHFVRGGAWDRESNTLRSAFRGSRGGTAARFTNRGFRVARTIMP